MLRSSIVISTLLGVAAAAFSEDVPRSLRDKEWLETTTPTIPAAKGAQYTWKSEPVSGGAQLLTLFCQGCLHDEGSVPVVSVLRDTAGDNLAENDRVSYVWLLSVPHLGPGQRILSAVPFFYWRIGQGSDRLTGGDLRPQMNLTAPQDPMMHGITRQLIQWTAFDPLAVWVRAPSRSYQSNAAENGRFHLEQTISYLRNAPALGGQNALTDGELKTVIARLELRKRLMGGLVDTRHARRFGSEEGYEEERVRSRNWELLRQCAEKTGLYFEPVDLGGATGQYGVLWFPEGKKQPVSGTDIKPIWKLLNIRDPWGDPRLQNWDGLSFERSLDDTGRLMAAGDDGPSKVRLVPLAFYSLAYPKIPLLLADFRDKLHIRRREMTQRSINQVTSGVIGVSRLANWYYFAGAMAYNFVAGRRGAAVSQAQRLDCYAQFRVHLAGDTTLDRKLYAALDARAKSLTVSPLDNTGDHAAHLARLRYDMLMAQTDGDTALTARLARDRRAELAAFGETNRAQISHAVLHFLTVGLYTNRVPAERLSLTELDRQRRFTHAVDYLGNAVKNGTQPEVAFSASEIAASVTTLQQLAGEIFSSQLRQRAITVLQRVSGLSKDAVIVADCKQAMAAIVVEPQPSAVLRALLPTAPSAPSSGSGGPETQPGEPSLASGGLVRGLK